MKTLRKFGPETLFISFVLLLFVGMFLSWDNRQADASTVVGNDYFSKIATSSASLGGTGTTSLRAIGGSLGSVIVSSSSPVSTVGPYMVFYDTASTTQATTTMTPIAVMGSRGGTTPPAGTYTFDIATAKGLQVWVDPAFAGTYVVTYR